MSSTYENLLWHFKLNCWVYRLIAITLAIVIGFVFIVSRSCESHSQRAETVQYWTVVDALILDSRLSEINTSDDTSFSTRLSLSAKFQYKASGTSIESDYLGTWTRQDHRDWSQVFKKGQTIKVRVSPSDPRRISLIDLTGVP